MIFGKLYNKVTPSLSIHLEPFYMPMQYLVNIRGLLSLQRQFCSRLHCEAAVHLSPLFSPAVSIANLPRFFLSFVVVPPISCSRRGVIGPKILAKEPKQL